ncbi:MAG: hypothetical protein ACK52I_06070, partial [Pseudomonadota bacterium]
MARRFESRILGNSPTPAWSSAPASSLLASATATNIGPASRQQARCRLRIETAHGTWAADGSPLAPSVSDFSGHHEAGPILPRRRGIGNPSCGVGPPGTQAATLPPPHRLVQRVESARSGLVPATFAPCGHTAPPPRTPRG